MVYTHVEMNYELILEMRKEYTNMLNIKNFKLVILIHIIQSKLVIILEQLLIN